MVLILASSQEWMSPGLDMGVLSLPMKVTTGRGRAGMPSPLLCTAARSTGWEVGG